MKNKKNSKEKELIDFYDNFSESYNDFYGELTEKHYLNKELSLLSKYYKSGNLLEIGMGTGKNLLQLKSDKIKKIIGADLSFQMCRKSADRIYALQASAPELPFRNNCIDNVMMFLFVHHLNYINKNYFDLLLAELKHAVNHNGKIIIKESNRLNPISRFIHFIIKETNMVNITPFYLLNTLKKHGYEIEQIIFYGFMIPKLPKIFYKAVLIIEKIIENLPLIKYIFCSHYIIIAKNTKNNIE